MEEGRSSNAGALETETPPVPSSASGGSNKPAVPLAGIVAMIVVLVGICFVVVHFVTSGGSDADVVLVSCTPSQKARSCMECNGPNSCTTCSSGYELIDADPTADPPAETCSYICTADQKSKGCTACDSASKCVQCTKGYKVVEDDFGTGASHCHFLCTVPGTNLTIEDTGYPQGACEECLPPDSSRCGQCREGYHLTTHPGPILDPDGQCIADPGPKELDFYMYKAIPERSYPNNGINMASAGGVLSYLHVEVVSSAHSETANPQGGCKRNYDIQKIQRWHVRVRNTPMVYKVKRGQFSQYVPFGAQQCTFGTNLHDQKQFELCNEMWRKYGYVVGCAAGSSQLKYPDAISYSVPGQCPQEAGANKTVGDCYKKAPGGQCGKEPGGDGEFGHPDGTPFCTYDMKLEGEVSLDQLVGLCPTPMCQRFHEFCMEGKVEYRCPPQEDHPECSDNGILPFWSGYDDEDRNRDRIKALEDLFQKNFPDSPRKSTPVCDDFQ